jgi:hypothetical protein
MGFGKSFASGGYTGDGPKDKVAGLVHAGEFVIPANVVNAIKSSGGSARAANIAPMTAAAPQVSITNNISVGGSNGDISGLMREISAACKRGVREANDMANVVVKTGNARGGFAA